MTFRGKTTATALAFAPHTVVRMTPTLHAVGALPPIPPAGALVPIDTGAGIVNAEMLVSERAKLVLMVRDHRLGLTPLKPGGGERMFENVR